MVNSIKARTLVPLLIAGLGLTALSAQVTSAELEAVAGSNLTPDQKSALAAVDARMVGLEALVAKVDDADYKADCLAAVADLKKRRMEMEKNFDQGLYEVLMHSLISRYQVVALWLKPPALPPPAGWVAPAVKKPQGKPGSSDNAPGSY